MTEMMKAGVATSDGLDLREVTRPVPSAEQVLVRVAAAGMNRADRMAETGLYGGKDSLGRPIGMEWAGEVVEVGSAVTGFRPGDLVMTSGLGGFAEYAVSDHGRTIKIGDLDPVRAAGQPMALLTAYDAVVTNGRLSAGESVLVQGASSAIGLMSMQIARSVGAKTIVGTSSNEARRARLAEFGATMSVDARSDGWVEQVLDSTGGKGVDLVVDMVSGATMNQTMLATAVQGRIVNVGRLGGTVAEFDFNLHALRRIEYIGVTFRTRSIAEIREIVRLADGALGDSLRAGDFLLPVDRTFNLSETKEALDYMSADKHFGKIVIVP